MSNVDMYGIEMRYIRDILNRSYETEKQRIIDMTAKESQEYQEQAIALLDAIKRKYNALCEYMAQEKTCSGLKNDFESAHDEIRYRLEEMNKIRKRRPLPPV